MHPLGVSLNSATGSRRLHHVEVGLLSQRGDSDPYPSDYSRAFAFSTIPYPLTQQVALRLPCRCACTSASSGAYHVPQIAKDTTVVRVLYPFRVCLSRGCAMDDVPLFTTETPDSLPFGYGLTAGLAIQFLPGFSRQFT
jgi:hypothetical protein